MISALLFVLLLLLLFFHLGRSKDCSSRPRTKLPPGPRGLPLIENLHQLSHDSLHTTLHHLASIYGPLMSLRLGSVRALVISSADAAQEAFKGVPSNDLALSGRPKLYATSVLFHGPCDIAFVSYGESWRLARKASIVDLLSPRRVQSSSSVRQEEVAVVVDYVADASSRGVVVDFSDLVMKYVNDVTCRSAYGRKVDDAFRSEGRLRNILAETQELISGFCVSDYFPGMQWVDALTGYKRRVWRNFSELDEILNDVIRSAKERMAGDMNDESKDGDLVTQLLRRQMEPEFAGAFSCMDGIKGVLMDIFIGGTDTSTSALIWTMAELIRNPKVLMRAQNEVRSIIGISNRTIDETIIQKLAYLKLVIKESLRLHPPSPLLLQRLTTAPVSIMNYNIPANTRVIINATAVGRDPNYWVNPDEFNPDRFLETGQDVDFRGQHFQLIPFGAGRRICPGINFSLASVELLLANLLCWFDWRLPDGESVEKMDMEEAPGLTVLKKTPLLLAVLKWQQ